MKTFFKTPDDFTVNNGVNIIPSIYKYTSPGMVFPAATNVQYDTTGPFDNVAFTTWVRFTDIDDGKIRFHIGCTSAGVGKSIDLVMSATNWKIQYNNISSWDGAPDAVNSEKDLRLRGMSFKDAIFYKQLRVYFNNILCIADDLYSPAGGWWGISGMDSATTTYVSDTYLYEEQCLWGNVNVNGVPQAIQGRAVLFNQDVVEVIEYSTTNADGDYIIFLEDDPINLNKYFLLGFIADQTNIQPRGVGNITI